MKETSWEECLSNNTARRITPDVNRARSLKETAQQRINLVQKTNKENCNFVFEDYYTSLLEVLQAHAFTKGYNILNHLCIGHYTKDALKREDLYRLFNDVRYKRNALTYYGKRMEYDVAKQAIQQCIKIIQEIKLLSKQH